MSLDHASFAAQVHDAAQTGVAMHAHLADLGLRAAPITLSWSTNPAKGKDGQHPLLDPLCRLHAITTHSAHQQLALQALWSRHHPIVVNALLPLVHALHANLPALQGPASVGTMSLIPSHAHTPHHGTLKLRLNHCWIQVPHRWYDDGLRNDIEGLLQFAEAAATCGPARHHYATDVTSLSAASVQDACTFMQAADPVRWPNPPRASLLRTLSTPLQTHRG